MSDEWLAVGGSHEICETHCEVSCSKSGGRFRLHPTDVKIEGDQLLARVGAKSFDVSFPNMIDIPQESMALRSETYCIGLVLFRCSDGAVIGACIGAWDCGS